MDSAPQTIRTTPPQGRPKAIGALRWQARTCGPTPANALILQPLPCWVAMAARPGAQQAAADRDDVVFAAGAALQALDAMLRADPPWLGCWRMRLALKAGVAATRLLRIDADEATLRDALHLTRPGDDPGPAGRLHALLRRWADRPLRLAEETASAILAEAGQGRGSGELAALFAADQALAERLSWKQPLPLHLAAVHEPALRRGAAGHRPRADDAGWKQVRHAVLLAGAAAAHAEAVAVARKAEALVEAFSRLRSRDGGEAALGLILSDDSVAPWRMPGTGKGAGLGSDRAARRFCEGLHAVGALRLLTDRSTFRLYGL